MEEQHFGVYVNIEPSDADDFIDSLDNRQQEKLRVRVLSALGRDEVLVNR